MTIELMFNAIADHLPPDLAAVAPPPTPAVGWLNGIKHWQVDYQGAPTSSA